VNHGLKFAALLAVGLLLGFTLFHSRFGFTSAWRQLIAVGNGTGLRAHTVLLGTAASVVMLVAASGIGLFGSSPTLKPTPIGLPLFVGAALFAIGMQLGGACASGTLFAVGSGQSSVLFTLFGFIAGSVIYTAAYPAFSGWPEVPGVMLADHLGWGGSWLLTIAALIAVAVITRRVQARRNPPPTDVVPSARGFARVVRGSWPMLVGAVVLGLLAGVVLLVSGSTWGVTFAFALWGAKFLQLIGLHPQTWSFWQESKNAQALAASAWTDKTTLTDVGIMIGAAAAAALAGAWTFKASIPLRTIIASVLGGILMGIGARLAGGCNIGAYLSGISAGNLSGWLWAVFALAGTWVGLKLRPLFGLGNPAPTDSVC
jgi:uncharacterized membrane protein YedE/YeeE